MGPVKPGHDGVGAICALNAVIFYNNLNRMTMIDVAADGSTALAYTTVTRYIGAIPTI